MERFFGSLKSEWTNARRYLTRAEAVDPFLAIERMFGFTKARCGGLTKDPHHLFMTCALTILYLMSRRLLRMP